jgi:Flp pilus assembly CpaF family ATPase
MPSAKRLQDIIRGSLSQIAPMMEDKTVTEIMVIGSGRVFVERRGTIEPTDIFLSENERRVALTGVAKYAGGGSKGIDIVEGTASAVISTSVGGLRFAGAVKGVDSDGTTLTIRKHLDPLERPDLNQLIEWDMLSHDLAETLVDLIIHKRLNCVFAGPTSGGKTTLANAILMRLPSHERIGLIEDAREMALRVEHKNCYLASPQTGLTAKVLVKQAMRERYDRLILSETRGDDTFDLLRALSSGHNGSVTTLHASSAIGALSTLELLFQMSLPPGVQMSPLAAQGYITNCINLIVFCARPYVLQAGGTEKSSRRVSEVAIVKGVQNGIYNLEYVFQHAQQPLR